MLSPCKIQSTISIFYSFIIQLPIISCKCKINKYSYYKHNCMRRISMYTVDSRYIYNWYDNCFSIHALTYALVYCNDA